MLCKYPEHRKSRNLLILSYNHSQYFGAVVLAPSTDILIYFNESLHAPAQLTGFMSACHQAD